MTKYVKFFWRGMYRTVIDIEIQMHKLDTWLYKKVDYQYFVNINKPADLVGVSRQPFRRRAYA